MNLLFWKHKKTNEVIKDDCHKKLSTAGQSHFYSTNEQPTHYYSGDIGGDFLLSAIVAEETNSTLLGMAVGGDIAGAIVGESLSSDNNSQQFDGFGGG